MLGGPNPVPDARDEQVAGIPLDVLDRIELELRVEQQRRVLARALRAGLDLAVVGALIARAADPRPLRARAVDHVVPGSASQSSAQIDIAHAIAIHPAE